MALKMSLTRIRGSLKTSIQHRCLTYRCPSYRSMSSTANNNQDRSNLIPFSSRLREGRALALDVWTIYK